MPTKPPDPDKIAKVVAKNHNLRALILRLADGEATFDEMHTIEEGKAIASATRRGLISVHRLTTLGQEVVELVRPAKWTAAIRGDRVVIDGPDGEIAFQAAWEWMPGSTPQQKAFAHAQRFVDLMNADNLAAAKRYQVAKS